MEIIYLKAVLVFLLLGLSAFFSGSETAFFSLTRYQVLKLKETPRGKIVAFLLERPARLLISILIGNESVNIAASALVTSIAIYFYGEKGKWLAVIVMTPLLLLCGEIVPKTIAFVKARSFCLRVAPIIVLFMRVIAPIRNVIKWVVNLVMTPLPPPPSEGKKSWDTNFLDLIEHGHKKGEFKAIEKDFIANLLRFRKKTVSEIMVPRPDIFAVSIDINIASLKKMLKQHPFTRIPVYKENLDNIIGILPTKFLLGQEETRKLLALKEALIPPYFVPETKKAEELFWELQKEKITIAIVVDEYGSVVGLITIEDLLEELFGEIYDEYDITEQWYKQTGSNRYRVLAKIPLSDFNYLFKTNFSSKEDTLAGFLVSVLGRLPQKGEKITIGNFQFTVTQVKGHRLIEVEVEKKG